MPRPEPRRPARNLARTLVQAAFWLIGSLLAALVLATTPADASPLPADQAVRMDSALTHACAIRTDGVARCWGVDAPPADLGPVTSISVGDLQSCAIRADGTVRCWGSTDPRWVDVPNDLGTVTSIAVNRTFACAVRTDAAVRCWGYDNLEGGLSRTDPLVPPADLGPVTSIASDGQWDGNISSVASHTCAIRTDGALRCWGDNHISESSPPGGTASAVSTGTEHSCALYTGGRIQCFGQGQWDAVFIANRDIRRPLGPPIGYAAMNVWAGAQRSCGQYPDGEFACWGLEVSGNFQFTALPLPDDVAAARTVVPTNGGYCIVQPAGSVRCWRDQDVVPLSAVPSPPDDLATVTPVQVDAGASSTCATNAAGEVSCWGANDAGQSTPPADLGAVRSLSVGGDHACAIDMAMRPRCWGSNAHGQLDFPSASAEGEFPIVFAQMKVITAGARHTCVIRVDDTPLCVGDDSGGQVTIPDDVGTVTAISAGDAHTCAIRTNGTPACWGANASGQVTIPSGTGTVSAIDAGATHTCAIKTGGIPICWGDDTHHQSTVPAGVGTVKAITADGDHTCAIRSSGTMVCWGDGLGAAARAGLFTTVSAGRDHTCATSATGVLACFGSDADGQLGALPPMPTPTPEPTPTPTPTPTPASNPTPTPTPAAAPEPTAMPTPTPTPEPTPTPTLLAGPTPTPTVTPPTPTPQVTTPIPLLSSLTLRRACVRGNPFATAGIGAQVTLTESAMVTVTLQRQARREAPRRTCPKAAPAGPFEWTTATATGLARGLTSTTVHSAGTTAVKLTPGMRRARVPAGHYRLQIQARSDHGSGEAAADVWVLPPPSR